MPKTNKPGNKVGRPKLPKGEALGSPTPIRFTTDEKAIFEKSAKKQGLPLSVWIRKTLKDAVER